MNEVGIVILVAVFLGMAMWIGNLIDDNRSYRRTLAHLDMHNNNLLSKELYLQFCVYARFYIQSQKYNEELLNAFKKYFMSRYVCTEQRPVDDGLFYTYLKGLTDTEIFSRDWSNVTFPPYTKEHVNKIAAELIKNIYGKEK